ncbi:hypothetical protein [Rickettsia sp. TH2014]|uniref:hypothetical protein n=1 Tax=Rickettsia sp. TH2014 TaxID=1967503 RepID=UPI001C478B5B|nr:hypothetical protein [Rickettsia sp. TH2014]
MKELIEFLKQKGFTKEATSLTNGATKLKLEYLWDEDAIEIAKFLRTDTTLTHFELEESLIEHTGIEAITQAIQTNYTITNCTIFLADKYVEIVGTEYCYEEILYEETKKIKPLIDRNKEYVRKLSLFINNLFSIDNENITFNLKNFMALNFYRIADKQLLKEYLREQQVSDIETKLKKVCDFTKAYPFTLSYIYKNINSINETTILCLPDENSEEINKIEEVKTTGNDYCTLS